MSMYTYDYLDWRVFSRHRRSCGHLDHDGGQKHNRTGDEVGGQSHTCLIGCLDSTWKTANLGLYIVSYKLRSSTVVGENVAGVWNGW